MRVRDRITRWLDTTDTTGSPLSLRNLNFFIEDNTLYSYGRHWPLAHRYLTARGYNAQGHTVQGWSILINECGYSGQTSITLRHLREALRATRVDYQQIPVGGRSHMGRAYRSRNAEIMQALIPGLVIRDSKHFPPLTPPDQEVARAFACCSGIQDNAALRQRAMELATLACKWQYRYLKCSTLAHMTPHQRHSGAKHIVKVIVDAWRDQQQHLILPDTLFPSVRSLKDNKESPELLYQAWNDLRSDTAKNWIRKNGSWMHNETMVAAAMQQQSQTELQMEQRHTMELIRQSAR